jgi:hypothetical protein
MKGTKVELPTFDGNMRSIVTIIAEGQGEYASSQRSPIGYSPKELEEIAKLSVQYRESRYQSHLVSMPTTRGGLGPRPRVLQYGVQYGESPYLWVEVEVPDKQVA